MTDVTAKTFTFERGFGDDTPTVAVATFKDPGNDLGCTPEDLATTRRRSDWGVRQPRLDTGRGADNGTAGLFEVIPAARATPHTGDTCSVAVHRRERGRWPRSR